MPTVIEGDFASPAGRFALIAARFNSFIVDQLTAGAVDALHRHGVSDDRIYLSLERNMHCGVGLCGHCQLGPIFLCKDGPILPLRRVARFFAVGGL